MCRDASAQWHVLGPKKGKQVEGTNLPILRLILNAIPSNAVQRIIEADTRALPYHGQWSGIVVDGDDRVIVWSESDTTAAFYCFLLEPSWYLFQATNKTVPAALAAEFDPTLAKEPEVYPALRVMPMGWQSACGLLQYFHRRLCFLRPPLGAGLDPSREIRRDMPLPLKMCHKPAGFLHSLPRRLQPGRARAHFGAASAAELPSETAAVDAAWTNWGIPRQLGKKVVKANEIEVLGARVAGPRAVAGKLIALSSWFCQEEPRTRVQAQIVGERWVRAFQFRREFSSTLENLWKWIRPEKMRPCRRFLPESMIDDVLLAVLSLLVCVADLRAKISPLVVHSDALEWRQGLSRTSSFTAQGQVALQEVQQATHPNPAERWVQ